MSKGLYSGGSGLALGVGLYASTGGLWSGSQGLNAAFGWSPLALFAASEPGGWYDPSDLSTLYQDVAGTTPVTAAGQTVARINDKSGRGNNLTQSVSASRPIYAVEPLGGRRNLLTYTEQFDNAAWSKTGSSISANAIAAPDGTMTADKLVEDTATGIHAVTQVPTMALNTTYTLSIYAKAAERDWIVLNIYSGTASNWTWFDVKNGVIGSATNNPPRSIQAVGNGWYRCAITVTTAASGSPNIAIFVADANSSISYAGTTGSGIYPYGAQLETGSTATAYQRVVSSADVTQSGVPSLSFLLFDGTDDFMVSPTITPGTDKAQVFAGVRKLSDAATGMLMEMSANANSNAGSLYITNPNNTNGTDSFVSRGSILPATGANSIAVAPTTSVLCATSDIAADTQILRRNGSQVGTSGLDQGTGNYLAYPLYVGRRAGASFPFNGRIYGLITRFGANLDAATIAKAEAWLNQRTGAF